MTAACGAAALLLATFLVYHFSGGDVFAEPWLLPPAFILGVIALIFGARHHAVGAAVVGGAVVAAAVWIALALLLFTLSCANVIDGGDC